jgi:hypothetical protein
MAEGAGSVKRGGAPPSCITVSRAGSVSGPIFSSGCAGKYRRGVRRERKARKEAYRAEKIFVRWILKLL